MHPECLIDCCILPQEFRPDIPYQATIQYALYKLVHRGWKRLCATLSSRDDEETGVTVRSRTSVYIDGLTRKYVYWSGDPKWVDMHGRAYDSHPHRYMRSFVTTQHRRRNGVEEIHGTWVWVVGEQVIDDTPNCFISNY
jgi:hypothetical protein